ncbi:MAG: UDP-N-acetylmuramoyl-tripeptide-D-alanyl-D-alanine ligase [Candidatus Saccharibacteria bacterium]|jgi:UDP-N-acetylmuramoyl-tripeptide--D-alanyl-D-alanine ligase|nr:UDP-N-acetylmuramoyl-tripeptide-D-alanyl-D-alanine ligase [Candidatus Saccharibacteria bacterium]
MFKLIIQFFLERYVIKYFKKHPEVKLIVVAGSVGKTSTKRAIATLLSRRFRVALEEGNHNTHLSAPLAILGVEYPDNVKSIKAWISVFRAVRERVKMPTGTDVIIQEIGADRPGDIAHFGKYLRPYMGVVTAVTPEHMEFFKDMNAVAKEELMAANFSELAIINRDDIEGRYAEFLTNSNLNTYGTTGVAEYRFETQNFTTENGYEGLVMTAEYEPILATIKVVGEHSLRPVMGAVAVAVKMGMTASEITAGLKLIRPVSGRMNVLKGQMNTIIIDDSYNSSPIAASSALQALYNLQTSQRIAVLGDMNELGDLSQFEHEKLGNLCDPNLLSWVVTVGEETEKYLAPTARQRGCQVRSFKNAIDAGAFVRSVIEEGAAILVKGSQGGIYTEEVVKILCHLDQTNELVRQSPKWLQTKSVFFSKFS